MFNPETMRMAQEAFMKMTPEQRKKMQEQAMNMDPNMIRQAQEQMKHITPEQMKAAQREMEGLSPEEMEKKMSAGASQSRAYALNGAIAIKMEGNQFVKAGEWEKAIEKYSLARSKLSDISNGADRTSEIHACLSNTAMCQHKLGRYQEAIDSCELILAENRSHVKALFRRGQARYEQGDRAGAVRDVTRASELSPDDAALTAYLRKISPVIEELTSDAEEDSKQINAEDEAKAIAEEEARLAKLAAEQKAREAAKLTEMEQKMKEAVGASDMAMGDDSMRESMMKMMGEMSPEDMSDLMSLSMGAMGADGKPDPSKLQNMLIEKPQLFAKMVKSVKSTPAEDLEKMFASSGMSGETIKEQMKHLDKLSDKTIERMAKVAGYGLWLNNLRQKLLLRDVAYFIVIISLVVALLRAYGYF